ncbi:hypothetical protein FB468_2755 [Leucobacter komagatae]|uniref:Uncharacterized protein n=1 Tax=Leucobacter komagatae TaxID=55969 RepID=A0A542Y9D0_9MICO|nr:hypothetical protein [Leucobacter komagatae]TQL44688.1 hypothetical protein FB468_2755 [Leucobacter komagatae]
MRLDSARIDSGLFEAIERRDSAEAGRIARGAIADRFSSMLSDDERRALAAITGP